mmetsp:Transcript_68654/g.198846  ORF Transcript_68654/g.198846 Transcript_68654/m.198846 type:complete len:218 (-) Transcript_68654:367-1020(-)
MLDEPLQECACVRVKMPQVAGVVQKHELRRLGRALGEEDGRCVRHVVLVLGASLREPISHEHNGEGDAIRECIGEERVVHTVLVVSVVETVHKLGRQEAAGTREGHGPALPMLNVPCRPEVRELCIVREGNQHVLRLHVPVHDAVRLVHVLEPQQDLPTVARRGLLWKPGAERVGSLGARKDALVHVHRAQLQQQNEELWRLEGVLQPNDERVRDAL